MTQIKINKAEKKWNQISEVLRVKLLSNVFCPKCSVTEIKDYVFEENKHGVLLKGKCSKCNGNVARLVED
jgi:hypothetical protein